MVHRGVAALLCVVPTPTPHLKRKREKEPLFICQGNIHASLFFPVILILTLPLVWMAQAVCLERAIWIAGKVSENSMYRSVAVVPLSPTFAVSSLPTIPYWLSPKHTIRPFVKRRHVVDSPVTTCTTPSVYMSGTVTRFPMVFAPESPILEVPTDPMAPSPLNPKHPTDLDDQMKRQKGIRKANEKIA